VGDLAWAYVGGHRIEYKRDPLAASFSIRRLLGVLRDNRDFRTLYAANAVSQLGDWFNVVALFSLLLELTGKGEAVAYALLTRFVPMFLAGPAAGVLADRVSRRAIMVASDLARVGLVLCLLFIRQADQVWIAYAVVTAHSVVSAFFEPAQQAMLPNLVSEADYPLAATLENSLWAATLTIGSALGGLALALVGRDAAFVCDAASFLGSAALISRLPPGRAAFLYPAPLRAPLPDIPVPLREGDERVMLPLQRLIAQAAAQYQGKDRETFLKYVQQDPMFAAQLRAPLYEDKVVDFLFSKADVTERKATKAQVEADLESEEGHVHGPGCGHDHAEKPKAKKAAAKSKAKAEPKPVPEEPAKGPRVHDRSGEKVRSGLLALLEHGDGNIAEPFPDLRRVLEQLAEPDRARQPGRAGADDTHPDLDPLVLGIG